jgi:hypothetical protein
MNYQQSLGIIAPSSNPNLSRVRVAFDVGAVCTVSECVVKKNKSKTEDRIMIFIDLCKATEGMNSGSTASPKKEALD